LKKNRPVIVTIFLVLASLVALVWLGFSLSIITGLHPTIHFDSLFSRLIAIASLLAPCCLCGLTYLAARHSKSAYWLLLTIFSLLTLASLADEMGGVDIAVCAVTAVTLGCLLAGRRWFLKSKGWDQ
jgi:hypothetical protein